MAERLSWTEILATKHKLKSVFQELGGENRLEEILLDFYHRMKSDILIGYFFEGKDIHQIARNQKHFLMVAMGIQQSYLGKLPGQAHEKLPYILPGHFDRRLTILKETLESYHLSTDAIQTWIELEEAFRPVLVKKH